MKNATLSKTDLEFIELMRSADEAGKELIWDAVMCTLAFGDDFLKDWGEAIDSGDRNKSEATLLKWKKAAQEKGTYHEHASSY